MKKLFEIPEAEILKLSAEDVVYTSGAAGKKDELYATGEGIDGGAFNPGDYD